MSTTEKKPPTQVAGVKGFSAFDATPAPRIDWDYLVMLPPFQMYAVERTGKPQGEIMAWVMSQDLQALYDDYRQWHKDKGYWPNETPMGELIAADGDKPTV